MTCFNSSQYYFIIIRKLLCILAAIYNIYNRHPLVKICHCQHRHPYAWCIIMHWWYAVLILFYSIWTFSVCKHWHPFCLNNIPSVPPLCQRRRQTAYTCHPCLNSILSPRQQIHRCCAVEQKNFLASPSSHHVKKSILKNLIIFPSFFRTQAH